MRHIKERTLKTHPDGRRFGESRKDHRERKKHAVETKQYRGRVKALQFENNVKAYGLAEAMRMAGMRDPERSE